MDASTSRAPRRGAEKSVRATRRGGGSQRGAALLVFVAVVLMAGIAFLVDWLALGNTEARRQQKSTEALAEARDALLGYALRYREAQIADGQPDRVYGYLPLPDLGNAPGRNNNVACTQEGCDAASNTTNHSVIGRLPWRTLGIEPLRDGWGECLWYALSGGHDRIQRPAPMNPDTLGHFDIVTADGSATLKSLLASPHERPVAIIFSPGPRLDGQDRAKSATDTSDVTQCGGNYAPANYLDPAVATALGGATNHFAGNPDPSRGDVSDAANPKKLSAAGIVEGKGGNFWPGTCPTHDCARLANDRGLTLGPDELFAALRKSAYYRADLNLLLDRVTDCLRDRFAAAGAFTPLALPGTDPGKTAGRLPDAPDGCYGDARNPLGYHSHYRDLLLVAKPGAGSFTVAGESGCAGALVLASQRGTKSPVPTDAAEARIQLRDGNPVSGSNPVLNRNWLANYLEDTTLAAFTGAGTDFGGESRFERVPTQTKERDIARCIPTGPSFVTATSPQLGALGFGQLAAYDPGTRTLTLGQENVESDQGAPVAALFGCAWRNRVETLAGSLRLYFTLQFRDTGSSVGNNGFVLAVADATANGDNLGICGAASSHLGYSGDNGFTDRIRSPKIGIEFDQSRNTGYSEDPTLTTNPGRNDPCGASSCGGTFGYNSHVAVVYWGHEQGNATDAVGRPQDDDNAHGFPSAGSLAGTRKPPRNPNATPGLAFKNLRGQPALGGDGFLYHVRLEITPQRVAAGSAELSKQSVTTRAWIEADGAVSAERLAAMRNVSRAMALLKADFAATLSDTADVFDVATGSACSLGAPCATGQACGSDNLCYRPALERVLVGFTNAQRTTDQRIEIRDFDIAVGP